MLLHDYLDRYRLTHDVTDSTLTHYFWVVSSFQRCHGAVPLAGLTGDQVSQWLLWLKDNGRSPWTIKQRRISLLVLWRSAWQDGLAPPLQPVRRLRPCHHETRAWTRTEVRTLIATAEAFPRRPLWTASLFRAAYDSGLRLGDLLAIDLGQFWFNGTATLTQRKTGRTVQVQFRPATLVAIRRHLAGRRSGLVWPWPYRREALYRHVKRVVAASGIRPGTFKWLRRSACTQLERVSPGAGTQLLGHASRSTTEMFYIDKSLLTTPPLPPL